MRHSILLLLSMFLLLNQLDADVLDAKKSKTPQDQLKSGLELLSQGDLQADSGKPNEAQATYHKAMEKILPSVRGLSFHHPVNRDETPRENLGKVLIDDWEKDITPAEFHLDEATWKALGLIPADYDLKAAYIQLLTEEVAAFYDPKTKKMHLIREPEENQAQPPMKPRGLLDLIMNRDRGFNKDEAQSVIAHELTHALDDQHFGLESMMNVVRNDDDAMLALSALMEGEATMTMMAVGQQDWEGNQITKTPSAGVQRLVRWIGPFLPIAGGETARKSPPVMYETLIFPYFQGLVFCTYLTNQGGWKSLNDAYTNPPISTEQILHPEKYRGPFADNPMKIDFMKINPPQGFKYIGTSVIGELTTRILLSQFGGKIAAEGWDGDSLIVFESTEPEKPMITSAWMTTWDSRTDAEEFAVACLRQWSQKPTTIQLAKEFFEINSNFQSEDLFIEIRGQDVLVLRGIKPPNTKSLSDSLWQNLRKTPKEFQWIPNKK
jgi:hypothetical protein